MAWYNYGRSIVGAKNAQEAMEIASLNWNVVPKEIYVDGNKVPGYIANAKENDGKVLGIVSNQYKIVQNAEAFSFTDNLLGEIAYYAAGSLYNDRKICLSSKFEDIDILGQKFENFLVFSNSHDGKGSIKISIIPVSKTGNPMNLPLKQERSWSTIHSGRLEKKMEQAKETLGFAKDYLAALVSESERLADTQVTANQKKAFMERLLPIKPDDGDRKIDNVMDMRNAIEDAINNNTDYKGTQWELVTAVSNLVSNMEANRKTDTFEQNKFNNIISGHYLLDRAYKILKEGK